MSAFVTLSGDRVCLRPWRDEDEEPFAAMNSDARVMEFFRDCLSRAQSDAMVDHIREHFAQHGFGLWAIEVPGVMPFIGFAGLLISRFSAHFTPCVEVGWRLSFAYWGHGYVRRRPVWPFATGLERSRSRRSNLTRPRRTAARERSWNGLKCAAILLTISSIPGCRNVIPSEDMCFIVSVRLPISACTDSRLRQTAAHLQSARKLAYLDGRSGIWTTILKPSPGPGGTK